MTIYFITRGKPEAKDSQWGSFEFDQAKALAKFGHKIVYLSVDSRMRLYHRPWGITKEKCNNVTSYNIYLIPSIFVKIFGRQAVHKLRVWQLKRIYQLAVNEEGIPDILYSHYLFITHEAIEISQLYHIPLVAMEHWSEVQQPILSPSVRRMISSYRHVNLVIAVSKALKKTLKDRFNIESCVINNMVGDEFFYQPHYPSEIIRFVATGSLRPLKGFDALINAFAIVPIQKEKWHLTIIGTGEELGNIQNLISKHHLTNNIDLVGAKTKSEIAEIYRQSDVFVLPSRSETFGVAYIEALACGLPCIATNCGGPAEFINANNGLLIPIDDTMALVDAISRMYKHHQQYDQESIATECKNRFSSEVIATQLIAIFEEVISKYHVK